MTRYRRNIGLNYLYSLLMNLNLTHGLWMIYLTGMGFPLVQLGLLEGIYHITGFLMEIWGRFTETAFLRRRTVFFSRSSVSKRPFFP